MLDKEGFKTLGVSWRGLHCPKCNTNVKIIVKRLDAYWHGDSAAPYVRLLREDCKECGHTIAQTNLTEEARVEWDENADYCSQNFKPYIVLKDQERAEMKKTA